MEQKYIGKLPENKEHENYVLEQKKHEIYMYIRNRNILENYQKIRNRKTMY